MTFDELKNTVLNPSVMKQKKIPSLMATYEYMEYRFGGSIELALLQYYMEK